MVLGKLVDKYANRAAIEEELAGRMKLLLAAARRSGSPISAPRVGEQATQIDADGWNIVM